LTAASATTPSPANAPKPWKLDFLLLAAIWGASFMFMRVAAVELGALPTAGLRVTIAAAFLLPLLLARGHGPVLLKNWKQALVVGIFNSAIPFVCFSFALLSISTGLSSILNAPAPSHSPRRGFKPKPSVARGCATVVPLWISRPFPNPLRAHAHSVPPRRRWNRPRS
jgi:hypothetical protein